MNNLLRILRFSLFVFFVVFITYVFSLALRVGIDSESFTSYFGTFMNHYFWISLVYLLVYLAYRIDSISSFSPSIGDGLVIVLSSSVGLFCITLIITIFNLKVVPKSTYLLATLLIMMSVGFYKFFRRIYSLINFKIKSKQTNVPNPTIIIGAGAAGVMLLREITSNEKYSNTVVAFLDDSIVKQKKYIMGVKVEGTTDDVAKVIKKYDVKEVLIALPSVSKIRIKEILASINDLDLKIKTKIMSQQILHQSEYHILNNLNDVQAEDLLGREPIKIKTKLIDQIAKGKTILITGAGGSIGSELCRQLLNNEPKEILILDISENGLYDLKQEILIEKKTKGKYLNTKVTAIVASIRDYDKLEEIFIKHRPELVFHAAAHKHVPLMEDNPSEALKNNVLGTVNVSNLADKYEVERFVLISTDKAVNPTNIMGATKRCAEMVIQSYSRNSKTKFVAVRFGNVLGSNGSVIPLFKKQIANGGPITVTHPDITRFFMTIPEASQLVIEAASYAEGGEIFILDMGEPVKILNLAENLIKSMGLRPYEDIEIKFTGLRAGEKLYEELLLAEEGLEKTTNKLIYIARPIDFSEKHLMESIKAMKHKNLNNLPYDEIKYLLKNIVPTYKDPEEINGEFIKVTN